MVPPRLKVVPSGTVSNDNGPDDAQAPEAKSAAVGDPEIGADAQSPAGNVAAEAVSSGGDAAAARDAADRVDVATPERAQKLRILEALLFAASEPLDETRLAELSRAGAETGALLIELQEIYKARGVNLVKVAGKWALRTAEDLSWVLERHTSEERRLSKAALETLAIIAYHQPVTRAEIEEIRGVSTSAGTIDILLETRWIRPRGRRRAPGRPVTYGTTDAFLEHFALDSIKDLPGLAEMKGSGLLDSNLPPGFSVPEPNDVASLMPDELPLEAGDDEAEQAEMALEDEPAEGEGDGEGEDRTS